ncbi:MAG TPA: tetratricopeptide repeat protein, partial [Isosphaeraceae bacterium]|nr:tetratricopeptide repeat protein [Isosphaeraceae bacterium]
RWDLGNSLNSLAGLKRAGAEEAYHRAIEVFTKLVASAPNDPRNRQMLAVTHINLGEFQAANGQAALAEASYNEAVTRLEQLVTEDPTTVSNQAYVGYALAGLGQLQLSLGKAGDARALFEQAIDHQQKALAASPSSSFARNNLLAHRKALAQVLLALHDHSTAAATAEQIAKEPRTSAALADAAGVLARCVPLAQSDSALTEAGRKTKAQALADRALALLREAIAKDPKTVDRIKANPDFEPLRSRDDFQKLIATGAQPPAQPKVD